MTSPVREGIDCSVCGASMDDGAGRDGYCDDCQDLAGVSIEVIDTAETVGHFDFYDYEPSPYDGTYSEE